MRPSRESQGRIVRDSPGRAFQDRASDNREQEMQGAIYKPLVCTNNATRLTIIVVIYCQRRVAKCVMDCIQVSWLASCASRTHKCARVSMFPRHMVSHIGWHSMAS